MVAGSIGRPIHQYKLLWDINEDRFKNKNDNPSEWKPLTFRNSNIFENKTIFRKKEGISSGDSPPSLSLHYTGILFFA